MKAIYFVGGSREDLRDFPKSAKHEAGVDLMRLQNGLEPRSWKPMPAVGKGAREIRERVAEGIFRVFYVVESAEAVYVLHAFQKKTQKTPQADIDLGKDRYKSIR
jgi:phage-related protein